MQQARGRRRSSGFPRASRARGGYTASRLSGTGYSAFLDERGVRIDDVHRTGVWRRVVALIARFAVRADRDRVRSDRQGPADKTIVDRVTDRNALGPRERAEHVHRPVGECRSR